MRGQAFVLCFLMAQISWAQALDHPLVPKEGKLLFIGQQKDAIDGYINALSRVPAGFMVYTSIQDLDGLEGPADHGMGVHDASYFINAYPHIAVQLGLYMVGALDGVLQGRYDQNITKLAQWIKHTGCPVYLRIGYEFDLPQNGYDPLKYQQAFRYIVDRLRREQVNNAAFVWHSANLLEAQGQVMDWYPGDDYVDWFAVTFFNPQQAGPAGEFFALGRAHGKALMIAESAPIGLASAQSKREWFKHYFDLINAEHVGAISYINSDWNAYPLFKINHWGDTRVESSTDIRRLWEKEIKDGGYVRYSLNKYAY